MAVVVKLMIGVAPLIAKSYDTMLPKTHILRTPVSSCFEIYGFDVMIDQDLKVGARVAPWVSGVEESRHLDSTPNAAAARLAWFVKWLLSTHTHPHILKPSYGRWFGNGRRRAATSRPG